MIKCDYYDPSVFGLCVRKTNNKCLIQQPTPNFNLDLGFEERARETILSLAEFIINVFMFSA